MPRKPLYRSDFAPYHVTLRSNNRELFDLDLNQFWELLNSECYVSHSKHGTEFHALVLMPNHIHILLTAPEADLGIVMSCLAREITKRSNKISGKTGRIFGGPYHWSFIDSAQYYSHALKYVYRNPVKAGLCALVEDYPYSSLHGLMGNAKLDLPVFFTRAGMEQNILYEEPISNLDWFNQPFTNELDELIKFSLKHNFFTQQRDRQSRLRATGFDANLNQTVGTTDLAKR